MVVLSFMNDFCFCLMMEFGHFVQFFFLIFLWQNDNIASFLIVELFSQQLPFSKLCSSLREGLAHWKA